MEIMFCYENPKVKVAKEELQKGGRREKGKDLSE